MYKIIHEFIKKHKINYNLKKKQNKIDHIFI